MCTDGNENRKPVSVDRILTVLAGRKSCDSCERPVVVQFRGRLLCRSCYEKERLEVRTKSRLARVH